MSEPLANSNVASPPSGLRAVRYEHSKEFVPLLERLRASLLISTYQAGKLAAVGTWCGDLALSFHNFERAMGVAVGADRLAVGTQNQVWLLQSAPQIAADIEPCGKHDACFLTRSSHMHGEIQGHEMAWHGDELWLASTAFSCLCTLDSRYSFVPRWKPRFVSELAAEDRCHLNGLAMSETGPAFVTVLGETDSAGGWRPGKASGGALIEVATGRTVARGFSMPHSPRVYGRRLFLLDSGTGRIVASNQAGAFDTVAALPGYTRGLAIHQDIAFVGLSKIRETSTFGGVPIAEYRDQLKCGVAAVDVRSGRHVAYLEFTSGVDEIFDVQVLPGVRAPAISGPFAAAEGKKTIWLAPPLHAPDGGHETSILSDTPIGAEAREDSSNVSNYIHAGAK